MRLALPQQRVVFPRGTVHLSGAPKPLRPQSHRLVVHAFALLVCILFAALSSQADDIKKIRPTGYVTDLADVIDPSTTSRLETLCTELEQKTGVQMGIVTVRSLDGEDVDQYGADLYKQLGIGNRKNDEGVLLLLAPNDRKYRIEVGYGLEPVINDARAGDAGRGMVPLLRTRNYSGAVEIGAWQLAKYVADAHGVTLSGRPPARSVRHDPGGSGINILWIILFIIFLSLIARGGRRGGGGGSGWWIWPLLWGMSSGSDRGRGWGGGGFGGGSGGWSGGGGFGGFGGGSSGGGGASGGW